MQRVVWLSVTSAAAWTIRGGLVPGLAADVPECAAQVQWFDAALTSMRGVPRAQTTTCADEIVEGVLPAMGARAVQPTHLIHLLDLTWAKDVSLVDYVAVCRAMGGAKAECATHVLDDRIRIWCAAVQRIAATPGVDYRVERRGSGRVGNWKLSPESSACLKHWLPS